MRKIGDAELYVTLFGTICIEKFTRNFNTLLMSIIDMRVHDLNLGYPMILLLNTSSVVLYHNIVIGPIYTSSSLSWQILGFVKLSYAKATVSIR